MRKLLLALLLISGSLAFGQGASPSGPPIALNQLGQPVPNATVAVCTTDPGPTPVAVCGSLATTYTNIGIGTVCTGSPGTQPLNNRVNPSVGSGCSNPGHADLLGNVVAFVTAGNYFCEYYGPGINGFFAQPCTAGGAGGGGAGNPALPLGSLQGNNSGVFGGIPTTNVNFTTGEVDVQNLSKTRNVTGVSPYNWSQTGAANTTLTAGAPATITVTPCPVGVDVSGNPNLGGPQGAYPIFISDGSNSESAYVTGGSTAGAPTSCTLTFTPFFNHTAAAYTIGSATSGAQEAVNDACGFGIAGGSGVGAGQCKISIAGNGNLLSSFNFTQNIVFHDTLYFHAYGGLLEGHGANIDCQTRGPCVQIGNLLNSNRFIGVTVNGLALGNATSNAIYAPCSISNTVRTSLVVTITLASACSQLRTGDRVTIILTDDPRFRGDVPSITVVDSTHFTYTVKGGLADIPTHASLGFVALEHSAILDNATGTTFNEVTHSTFYTAGQFSNFFDMWDDENTHINNFNNNGFSLLQGSTWIGAIVYSGGAANLPTSNQLAPVIAFQSGSITNAPGFWVDNNNGLYVRDTVIQNSVIQAHTTTMNGNFQGAFFENIYSETPVSSGGAGAHPWGGTGVAGFNAGTTSGTYEYRGNQAFTPRSTTIFTQGSGGTCFTYYIVVHDATAGAVTNPVPVMYACQNSASTPTVSWPRIVNFADSITYDVLRCPGQLDSVAVGVQSVAPYAGQGTTGSPGGATNVCGSVVTAQAQQNSFVQTFVDNTANNTTAYSITYPPTFSPILDFWPGQVIISGVNPLISTFEQSVSGFSIFGPVNIADYCLGENLGSAGYTQCAGVESAPPNNAVKNTVAMFLSDGPASGGGSTLSKGKLNFTTSPIPSIGVHHIITLVDSNAAKTQAFGGYRPLADAADTYLGIDGATGFGNQTANLSIGSNQISMYITNVGDNVNWKERLTGSLKTFTVPVNSTSGFQQNGNPLGLLCATTSTCANTAQANIRMVHGTAPLVSGTPSAVTITGISPAFTSTSTFNCTVSENTAASAIFVTKVSGSSITITGPNTVTDTVSYICIGN